MAGMFETERFREQLERTVNSEAYRNGMSHYETAIPPALRRYAIANESILMEREMQKSSYMRRGVDEALESVRVLIREASIIASQNHRTLITKLDFDAAYQRKFCQVWPFCRS